MSASQIRTLLLTTAVLAGGGIAHAASPGTIDERFRIQTTPMTAAAAAEDAILMFYTSGLDALVVEDWIVVK